MRLTALLTAFALVLATGLGAVRWIKANARWREIRAAMASDLEDGSLPALLRARAAGLHLGLAQPDRAEVHAELAFVTAVLMHDHGLPLEREAKLHLARAWNGSPTPAARAARSILAIVERPDRVAGDLGPTEESPHPMLARGHAHAARGDFVQAARAYQAAMVIAPAFRLARLCYVEALLAMYDGPGAVAALRPLGATEPDARWAVARARASAMARGVPARLEPGLEALCLRDAARAPYVAAECALLRAEEAFVAGDDGAALALLRNAVTVSSPKVLARVALWLASAGFIDEAERLCQRVASVPDYAAAPSMRWVHIALRLGHGESVSIPGDLVASTPETRLLAARASLANESRAGLVRWLGDVTVTNEGPPALRWFVTFARGTSPPAGDDSPAFHYIAGLSARLRGDDASAITHLTQALEGHGDACRALGELIAAARETGGVLEPTSFERVRSVNRRCINLDGVIQEASPARKVRPRDTGERRGRSGRG